MFHGRNRLLSFNEEKHVYYYDGIPFKCSVTKFTSKYLGKFEREKIAKAILYKVKNNKPTRDVYEKCNSLDDIYNIWKESTTNGSFIHNKIECFFKYDEIYTKKSCKLYVDYLKFNDFYDNEIIKKGWKTFYIKDNKKISLSEVMVYTKPPNSKLKGISLAGTVDLVVYRQLENGNYQWWVIDWKRVASPDFIGKKIYKNGPLKGFNDSTHLKHSLQLWTYVYILENYYSKNHFLFKPEQLFKVSNVYFCDKYISYKEKECINLRDNVKEMFERSF